MFQSLIGKIQTSYIDGKYLWTRKFQSLIGKIQTYISGRYTIFKRDVSIPNR